MVHVRLALDPFFTTSGKSGWAWALCLLGYHSATSGVSKSSRSSDKARSPHQVAIVAKTGNQTAGRNSRLMLVQNSNCQESLRSTMSNTCALLADFLRVKAMR